MVTMRTQMTVKTRSARTPPITAYGTALCVSTTALGSEKEQETNNVCVGGVRGRKGKMEIKQERNAGKKNI